LQVGLHQDHCPAVGRESRRSTRSARTRLK